MLLLSSPLELLQPRLVKIYEMKKYGDKLGQKFAKDRNQPLPHGLELFKAGSRE
jgi:hypothetical protein